MPYEIDDDKLSHIIALFSKQVLSPFYHKTQNFRLQQPRKGRQCLTHHGDSCFITDSETQLYKPYSN